MCGGSPSIPSPPPAKEPAAPVQQAVAPAMSGTAGDSTINANRRGKSKLRIDLDPIAAGSAGGSSSGTGLSV